MDVYLNFLTNGTTDNKAITFYTIIFVFVFFITIGVIIMLIEKYVLNPIRSIIGVTIMPIINAILLVIYTAIYLIIYYTKEIILFVLMKILNPHSSRFNKTIGYKQNEANHDEKIKLKKSIHRSLNRVRGYRKIVLQPLISFAQQLRMDVVFIHKTGIYLIKHTDGEEFYSKKIKLVIGGKENDKEWSIKIPEDLSIEAKVINPIHKMKKCKSEVKKMIDDDIVNKEVPVHLILAHTRNMTFNLDETNGVFLHTCRTNKVHTVDRLY